MVAPYDAYPPPTAQHYPYPYPRHATVLRPHRRHPSIVFVRGVGIGTLAGAMVGGTLGTIIFPLIGTFYGLAIGIPVAFVLSLVCALTLAAFSPLLHTRGEAALVAGGIAASWSIVLLAIDAGAHHQWVALSLVGIGWPLRVYVIVALVCGAVGAVVGPGIVFGRRR